MNSFSRDNGRKADHSQRLLLALSVRTPGSCRQPLAPRVPYLGRLLSEWSIALAHLPLLIEWPAFSCRPRTGAGACPWLQTDGRAAERIFTKRSAPWTHPKHNRGLESSFIHPGAVHENFVVAMTTLTSTTSRRLPLVPRPFVSPLVPPKRESANEGPQ